MDSEAKKPVKLALSVYGYGMMCFSVAIAILLTAGFFTRQDSDLYFSWGVAILAGCSGALALAMIKGNFPYLSMRNALMTTAFLNIFLFGSYLTSYLGYSRLSILKYDPGMFTQDAFQNLCADLKVSWICAMLISIFCTFVYYFIERVTSSLPQRLRATSVSDASTPSA